MANLGCPKCLALAMARGDLERVKQLLSDASRQFQDTFVAEFDRIAAQIT